MTDKFVGCQGVAMYQTVLRSSSAFAMAVGLLLPAHAASAQTAPAVVALADSSDIVVTARKRSERVEDIPLTIAVLGGDALKDQAVLRPRELQFAVPGFYVQNFETRATITLRGVGAQIAGGTSAVATHVNGIYQASSAAQLNRLFDVERVEVLKGPQGTLYGRNSTGGALNIITKSPGDKLEGDFSAGYGSYNNVRLDGGVTLPIADGWAVRLAGSYDKGDGEIFNRFNNRYIGNDDFFGGRITLKGKIGGIDANAFAQYTRDRDNRQPTLIPIVTATAQPLFGWDQTVFDSPTSALIDRKMFLAGVNFSGEITDGLTWKSVTGILDYHDASATDVNPTVSASQLVISAPQKAKEFSQELQLLYHTGKVDAVLGAYYLNDRQPNTRVLSLTPPGLLLFNSQTLNKTQALAGFTDVSYHVTDQLTLSGGLRVNRDKIRNSFQAVGALDGASFDLNDTQTSTTWRAGVDYKIHDGLLLYASVSTGFQAGFSQSKSDAATGASLPSKVAPEKLTAYESGLKLAFANGRGFFNVSGFYYNYRDLQVSVGGVFLKPDGTLDPTKPTFFYTDNAGKARIYGIDAQLADIRLQDHFKIDGSAEWLHAKFTTYNSFSSTKVPISYAGNTLPRAPEFSSTVAATVDHLKLASKTEGQVRLEYNYRSRTYFSPDNTVLNSQGPVGLINATARINFNGGRWALTATGRNLANKRFFDFYGGSNFGNVGEFRTWEVGAALRF